MLTTTAYFVGLDLGQTSDYTALAVLERTTTADPKNPARRTVAYAVRHLQRWKLGTPYTSIATDTVAMLDKRPLADSTLAIDQTGVGRPVVDVIRGLNPPARLLPITITGGAHVGGGEDGSLHVPKKELVGVLQVLLQGRRLKVSRSLPDAGVLAKELTAFRVKITAAANETFEAWRERDHDDLVLAVALAAWAGEYTAAAYDGPLVLNDWADPWGIEAQAEADKPAGQPGAVPSPPPVPPTPAVPPVPPAPPRPSNWDRYGLPGSQPGEGQAETYVQKIIREMLSGDDDGGSESPWWAGL